MSKIKQRNGIWQYHHNEHRFSLKTRDKKLAKELQDHFDRKRLLGQLNQKRMRILDLTAMYSYNVREEAPIAESTKRKVVHQIAMFTEFIRETKGNTYIDEITPDVFHRYATWRKIMSLKNDMMSLNKMFSWANARGLCPEVLVPVGDYHIKKSHKHRPITHEEFLRLYGSAHTELYKWLYYTGLRPSDAIRVHGSMIKGRVLTLTPQKTRDSSAKEIQLVLHKEICYYGMDGFALPEYLAYPSLLDAARREIKKILGKEVTLYSLRYSFNARLKELGADIELRKDAMGHTNIRTTEGYSTQDLERMAMFIDRME